MATNVIEDKTTGSRERAWKASEVMWEFRNHLLYELIGWHVYRLNQTGKKRGDRRYIMYVGYLQCWLAISSNIQPLNRLPLTAWGCRLCESKAAHRPWLNKNPGMFKMINHNEYDWLYNVMTLCFKAETKPPKQRKNTECETEIPIQRFQRRNHREIGKLQGRLERVSLTWVLMEKDLNKSIKTPKNRLRRWRNS